MERGEYPLEPREEIVEEMDDDSADEAYERSKDEERCFQSTYAHHEE